MPTLEEAAKLGGVATHLLLVGHSKTGKTDYVAQAIKAGFSCICVDRDNAMATLIDQLGNDPEAMNRVQYFAPDRMGQFIEGILTERVYRHNERTNERMTNMNLQDDDVILEIYPSRIPKNMILFISSWTALTSDIIEDKAKRSQIDLMDADKFSRELYGSTGLRATQFATILQHAPFHVIVEAHPGNYERKEKPPGRVGDVKENDMIIKETNEVPISTSLPHGSTLPKYFNQVGYMVVDNANRRRLDFRTIKGRIGGGTPGGIDDPRGAYSFANLFGRGDIALRENPELPWLMKKPGSEFKVAAKAPATLKGGSLGNQTPTPAAANATTAKPSGLAMFNKGK